MNGPDGDGELTIQVGPFNNAVQEVSEMNFVISYDDGNWDNNNGQDYLIPIDEATDVVPWINILNGLDVINLYANGQDAIAEFTGIKRDYGRLVITDATGRIIQDLIPDRDRMFIDLSDMSSGMYIFSLYDMKGGFVDAEKWMKR